MGQLEKIKKRPKKTSPKRTEAERVGFGRERRREATEAYPEGTVRLTSDEDKGQSQRSQPDQSKGVRKSFTVVIKEATL